LIILLLIKKKKTYDITWHGFIIQVVGEHVTNDKSLLINLNYKSIMLFCANGSIFQFEGYGTYECFLNKQIH